MSDRTLEQIQRWLQSVIAHPSGVVSGIESATARDQIEIAPEEIETVITRSRALSSVERLGIYAHAYYARLLQCLAEEFPALHHAVGTDTFNSFAFGYLQAHPSTSYTLADLSARFPRYLQETRPARAGKQPDWADFIIDLATLERTYSEVFDGQGAEEDTHSLRDELANITPENWLACRLKPLPCLRLLECAYPVHEYATAVRNQQKPPLPEAEPTWLVISRRDYIVRRNAITQAEYVALQSLQQNRTIAETLQMAMDVTRQSPEELTGQLTHWFQSWAAKRYFSRVVLPVS